MVTYETLAKMAKNQNSGFYEKEIEEQVEVPIPQIPKIRAREAQKVHFAQILSIIELFKNVRSYKPTRVSISSSSDRMISIAGSQSSASRLIKIMKQIGIISVADDFYSKDAGVCKQYWWFYQNEVFFKEYCRQNNIGTAIHINSLNLNTYGISTYIDTYLTPSIPWIDSTQIRFNCNLHLRKPTNWSKEEFNDYLKYHLYKNYPYLQHYQLLADEINQKYYSEHPELSIQFIPKITWNYGDKSVKSIGIRATNWLDSKPKGKEKSIRKMICQNYGFIQNHDVSASVPRMTKSLNEGKWIEEGINLYNQIIEQLDEPITKEELKPLILRLYFDNPELMTNHILRFIPKEERELIFPEADKKIRRLREAMERVIGHFFNNEIFFIESCVYIDVLNELLKDGLVWLVYDCFYTTDSREDFEDYCKSVIEKCFNRFFERFFN